MERLFQSLIRELKRKVEDAALKTARRVIFGIIQQAHCSHCAHGKSIGMNTILRNLCLFRGLTFIDPYNHSFERSELYHTDKTHLNRREKSQMGRLVEGAFSSTLIQENQNKTASQSVQVVPIKVFASMVTGDTS